MKEIIFPAILLFSLIPLASQETATTESGKKISVFADGTWKAQSVPASSVSQATTNIPKTATAKAPILKGKSTIFFNPKKWHQKGIEESGKSHFEHTDGDVQAYIITERIQIPLESLEKIALDNAKAAASDAVIHFREMRTINGTPILALGIKGTIEKIPFQYFGYYHSGKSGTIQALTYTSQNLFDDYKADLEEFLNGLVITP